MIYLPQFHVDNGNLFRHSDIISGKISEFRKRGRNLSKLFPKISIINSTIFHNFLELSKLIMVSIHGNNISILVHTLFLKSYNYKNYLMYAIQYLLLVMPVLENHKSGKYSIVHIIIKNANQWLLTLIQKLLLMMIKYFTLNLLLNKRNNTIKRN